jgi:hypothetical protein
LVDTDPQPHKAALPHELLAENDEYLAHVGNGVWLMDDHRWALQVWETERKSSGYTLIHADYHWDACYDFYDLPDDEADLIAASPQRICELTAEGELIRYDSFIAPAIRRGLIHTVHFYCLQDGLGDNALDEKFLLACGAKQIIHSDGKSLALAQISGPTIFDLCLDLFNRSDQFAEGDLWPDVEILEFLETVRQLIKQAELVTVSMSFNFSGTEADTRHLSQLVLPIVLAFRA